ncbi:hypothetical protein EKD04_017775 [Chloroflexales bacterium ZM16-3]|nr:hypothetical protein [Chloroflexales bacterium ZM16-3]
MASLGRIPDFSTARLYATVVLNTRDDPRLLALWCHCAIWHPIDRALGDVSAEVWAERTGFTPEEIDELANTLIDRKLLMHDTSINWFILEQASREAVLPYSNELRRREGMRPLVLTQPSLLPE